jgi:hypothetical protein
MLLTRTRQLYFPIRTSGGGLYNFSIEGRGIFQNSMKTIGKYALFGLKNLQPRTGNEAKEHLDENKNKNKDKIQKVISDESKQQASKLFKRKKYYFTPKITKTNKEILEKLVYGDGLKLLK